MIRKMKKDDLEETAKLLDAYRVFYKQESDYKKALQFLTERFEKQESIVFVAENNHQLVGFTQLYPIFTTVGLNRGYLLNDLYVDINYRKQGYGSALIQKTFDYGKNQQASFILLETAIDNTTAQRVYKKNGMKLEDDVYYFYKSLK